MRVFLKGDVMAIEEKVRTTVKMKYVGIFKGTQKIVELPIPLVSNSQKLEENLKFIRGTQKGPAFCDVPLEWAGALLAVGGNWRMNETLTPALQGQIDAAHAANTAKMEQFALDNEMVEA